MVGPRREQGTGGTRGLENRQNVRIRHGPTPLLEDGETVMRPRTLFRSLAVAVALAALSTLVFAAGEPQPGCQRPSRVPAQQSSAAASPSQS